MVLALYCIVMVINIMDNLKMVYVRKKEHISTKMVPNIAGSSRIICFTEEVNTNTLTETHMKEISLKATGRVLVFTNSKIIATRASGQTINLMVTEN